MLKLPFGELLLKKKKKKTKKESNLKITTGRDSSVYYDKSCDKGCRNFVL